MKSYFIFFLSFTVCLAQSEPNYTIGFYNLENLFDAENDPFTHDEEYTSRGAKQWSNHHFQQKIEQLSSVIASIGFSENGQPPLIIGLAEVENRSVLKTLINSPHLKPANYAIVHFESPDFRGIDVGMLYRADLFNLVHQKAYVLKLIDKKTGFKRTTRDLLVVGGYLNEHYISVVINHWPSRRGGKRRSASSRFKAAQLHRHITDSILKKRPEGLVISMGDFNDNPTDKSIQWIMQKSNKELRLFNPMIDLYKKGEGSLAYNDRWFLFDQILFSHNWIENGLLKLKKVRVFHPSKLITPRGKYQGYPYRTNTNGRKLMGYSDHFPVYAIIGSQ